MKNIKRFLIMKANTNPNKIIANPIESARKILMKEDYETVVKRRFQRRYNMMECKSYMKNEEIPENKEMFIYGLKHNKTDKIDNCILIGCESDELCANDKLFIFWSNTKKRDRMQRFHDNRMVFFDLS